MTRALAGLGLAAGLLLAALPVRAAPRVAAIQSDALESYGQVLSGFAAAAPGLELDRYSLDGDPKKADAVLKQALAQKPALILAVGPLAANAARKATSDVPVVFCMVPNYEKYGLEARNVTGIALTRPIDEQLAAIKALLPDARRVGVLYTPEYSQELVAQSSAAAQRLGLTIRGEKLSRDRDVGSAAAALAGNVDAIWLIADRGIATVAATRTLISASKDAKVPLFALAEGQVREGALVAFTANPLGIGMQAGRLGSRIALEHVNAGALAVLSPSGLDAWVNLTTTRAIGLDAAFSARLLDYAGQKGLAVRVVP